MTHGSHASVRMLRRGERLPLHEPTRRTDGQGYIRLIWKIDVDTYVEAYEHRVEDDPLVGRFITYAHYVRHIDGDHSNNRPENLDRRYVKRRQPQKR